MRLYSARTFMAKFEAQNQQFENRLKIEKGDYSDGARYLSKSL